MKSSSPLITSCVCRSADVTILVVIVSTLPLGMPGMLKFGSFSITNSRLGTDLVNLYGPMPGGGSADRFLNGVSPGTTPAKVIARMLRIVPSAVVSSSVTLPVSSLVSIPEMSPSGLPASTYSWAPSMTR